jgi:gas vesicle protein
MSDRYDDGRGLAMLIAGFGLGSLVGTVIGLLIAPKAGRELRADIAEYGKDYLDKVKDVSRDAYEKGRDRARQAYETGRQRATEYSSRVAQQVGEVRENVTETAQRFGNAVRSGIEEARDVAYKAPEEHHSEF